jgi:hypothetical protein
MQRYWCCISTRLCDTVVHFTFAASVLLLLHLLVLLTSLCPYEYSLPPVVLITGLTGVTGISCRLMPDNRRSVATARPVTDNRHFIPVHNTSYSTHISPPFLMKVWPVSAALCLHHCSNCQSSFILHLSSSHCLINQLVVSLQSSIVRSQ